MIRTLTSFIFLLTFFSGFSNLRGADDFQQNLTGSEMNELIARYNIPGMAIAIISKDSTWIGTFGVADKNSRVPVTEHTIFRIGSISKSFLAIAINQLADEGKIDLNDPVKEILPDLYMPNQWEEKNPVRIIHLLEHTSGIDDVHFNEGYNTTGLPELPLETVFAKNPASRKVRWKPGEITSYSNDAFSILALIVEKVTGQPFEVVLKSHVFDPIGAVAASYTQTSQKVALYAQGYTSKGFPLAYTPVFMRPSGGLNASVSDVACFVQMLLNKGFYKDTRIIDSTTLNSMLLPAASIAAKEGFRQGYGSGFSTFTVNNIRFFGHGGGLPDFNSIFLFHPEAEVGIVVLINKNSDHFWQLVKKVVSVLPIEKEKSQKSQYYAVQTFSPEVVTGYYTQVDYGISLDRFPNYFLSGQKVFYQNDTLFIKGFQSEPQALIPVNGNAYKRVDEAMESVYFFRNSDGEQMLTLSGKSFYTKDGFWKPLFHRIFLLFALFIIFTFLLYGCILLISKIISSFKKQARPSRSLRSSLFPLVTIFSLIICLVSLSMWFGDYNNAGNMTLKSLLVFIFSLLFPLLSAISFWNCCFRKFTRTQHKFERIYLMLVSTTLVGLAVFLYHYEIIGLRLWAY